MSDIITLTSGRQFYANHGLISISLTEPGMSIGEGYDGYVFTDFHDDRWTPEEKLELADRMIQRWNEYRVAVTLGLK